MINIEGLQRYQAIKVGDKYVVQLNHGSLFNNESHIVNGEVTNAAQIVVEDFNGITTAPVTSKTLSHYTDGNVNRSVEYINDIHQRKSEHWDEHEDDYVYPDIETQIEILKLEDSIKSFKPVFEETTSTPAPVKISVVGVMEDTGSDFITTSYSLGKASFNNENGVYQTSFEYEIALDEFKRLKEANPNDEFEYPTHSGLRFGQVNGKYAFHDSDPYVDNKRCYKRVFASLQQAKSYEKTVRNFVRNRVNVYLKNNQGLGEDERSELYKEMRIVSNSVGNLHVKHKSEADWRRVLHRIKDLIEKLGD